MISKQNDNRMAWIRNLARLSEDNASSYFVEYEIASEVYISGMLNYESKILCGFFMFEQDENGLYHYLLRIQLSKVEVYNKMADKNGYYFSGSILGELLSLFSLYFQCRFYVVAEYHAKLTATSLKHKMEYKFLYKKCNKKLDPKIFNSRDRNFSKGLDEFLNLIKKLKEEKHQDFILACRLYLLALREVGLDDEMVFVRLVSSIETLSKNYKLTRKENPLEGSLYRILFEGSKLSKEENKQLQEILFVNCDGKITISKISKKFVKFIEYYSQDMFKEKMDDSDLKITNKDLPKILQRIYKARSLYLHEGEAMYLSQLYMNQTGETETGWDIDPSLGMTIDNRRFTESQKLPYGYWFENIVRFCLLSYLKDNVAKKM